MWSFDIFIVVILDVCLLFGKLLIQVSCVSILANVYFQLSPFLCIWCIWMPRHFLDPIRYLLYVNGMFFVELAQGSYLTFTHFRSTQKHVMCMDVFRWKYGFTRFNYKMKYRNNEKVIHRPYQFSNMFDIF